MTSFVPGVLPQHSEIVEDPLAVQRPLICTMDVSMEPTLTASCTFPT
eukprot:CAMPEP_0195302484 /NCGR_PEP_ID=MMETSP0707-20130614/31170_1 /TAXON_ID=33640 /ORGANISM="Asterionellopsis glacialis, Strain CCMP134" /LENGTH=46 /DNA_ID= /DNA_START= /DNA_END= /DNA_ORIENTATION=